MSAGSGGRSGTVSARAFPKLTLALAVLGLRDDGYHDLEALTVSIGQPHDAMEVTPHDEPGVSLELVPDDPEVPVGDDNLVVRAARELLGRAGLVDRVGVGIALTKRIPSGAGLGGGSADGAATLVAVRAALGLDVDDATLIDIAADLGSDVPFCLHGGAARMTGRGERLERVDLPLGIPFLLAVPEFRCSTPEVYAAWDELGGPRSTRVVPAPAMLDGVVRELVNDLEPAAELVEPGLAEFRARLEVAAGAPAILAGSGSAYAVPIDDPKSLPDRAAEASERLGTEVIPVATISRGVRISGRTT